MRRGAALLCMLGLLAVFGGCGKETAQIKVPQVEVAETPEITQTEEQARAALDLETEAGTELEEEEVFVMQKNGETITASYTRVRGNGDFSMAYDPHSFFLQASDEKLRFEAMEPEGELPVFLTVVKEEEESSEELADRLVAESGEECTVEEVTVGEGEYPALWISYAEGTSPDSRTCDIYIFRHNGELYVAQLDCSVEDFEWLGGIGQTILSTLRFDEG